MSIYTAWFDPDTGVMIAGDMWRDPAPGEVLLATIRAQHGVPDNAVMWQTQEEAAVPNAPCADIVAAIDNGAVVPGSVRTRDGYQPESAQTPTDQRLSALEAAVAGNILASPHDRRWLEQKERAKLFGVPWLKAHSDATQADMEVAVIADLVEAFPGEPIVVGGGVLMSYAAEAAKRGYIPSASFEALKALVVGASDAQLQAMLAAL